MMFRASIDSVFDTLLAFLGWAVAENGGRGLTLMASDKPLHASSVWLYQGPRASETPASCRGLYQNW
jgi:hypothetical protein